MIYNIVKTKVIGVDISNDRTTYAVVDIRGNIFAKDHLDTTRFDNPDAFVGALSEGVVAMIEANGGYESIRSIGVSAPSANSQTGYIENAANLPWKGSIPLAVMLRERIGLAVGLSNDAHISALGEYAFGSAHGMKNFIVVALGVGLGSCFFSEDREHFGNNGFAGEFGHTCVEQNGRLCGCGHRGCLESYVASKGIVQTACELMAASDEPSLMRDISDLSPKAITDCCEQGDKMAIEVYRRTGYLLGVGLANYASIIDPEAIILTGGIALAGKWLYEPTYESFEAHIFGNMRGKVKLLLSQIDNHERDVLGASVLAWSVPEYSLFK